MSMKKIINYLVISAISLVLLIGCENEKGSEEIGSSTAVVKGCENEKGSEEIGNSAAVANDNKTVISASKPVSLNCYVENTETNKNGEPYHPSGKENFSVTLNEDSGSVTYSEPGAEGTLRANYTANNISFQYTDSSMSGINLYFDYQFNINRTSLEVTKISKQRDEGEVTYLGVGKYFGLCEIADTSNTKI
jgi:hypothetical protein